MNAYVAPTDFTWFQFLSAKPDVDEVNFWMPNRWGGRFGVLQCGEPLLFKLNCGSTGIYSLRPPSGARQRTRRRRARRSPAGSPRFPGPRGTACWCASRREREGAEAREPRLGALAGQEPEDGRRVETLIAEREPAAYDEAVRLLGGLQALAARTGRTAEVEERIGAVRARHARKATLLNRLERAGTGAAAR